MWDPNERYSTCESNLHPRIAQALSNRQVNEEMKLFCAAFDAINPLSKTLRRMATFNAPNLKVVFRHTVDHPCVCAFMTNAVDMQRSKREILIWKSGEPKEESLDICSPFYEPLQYCANCNHMPTLACLLGTLCSTLMHILVGERASMMISV